MDEIRERETLKEQQRQQMFEDENEEEEKDVEEKIAPERLERLNQLLDTVLTIDAQDLDYFNRGKKKQPPRMEFAQKKRGPKPKNKSSTGSKEADLNATGFDALYAGLIQATEQPVDPQYSVLDRRLEQLETELGALENPVGWKDSAWNAESVKERRGEK